MDLRLLRYFQAVAEELSFSKAAQKLHIAQPALSRAVADLEANLGILLLARTKRRVALTPAGAVLLQDIGVILGLIEETVRKVKRTAEGQEGELRVGFIGPPTKPFLVPLLAEFRKRYPKVTVVLEERTPERVWEMVSKNRIDVGLTRPVAASERIRLETMHIRKEPICAVFTKNHPLASAKRVTWSALKNQPLIMLARREGVGMHDLIMKACQNADFHPRIAYAPSIVGTTLTYVEADLGIGVVPESVGTLANQSNLIFKPIYPIAQIELVLAWSKADLNPVVKAFRDLIKEMMASKNRKSFKL